MTIVRDAVDGDIDALANVHTRGWQAAYRGQLPDEVLDALDPVQRAVEWRELLADPGEEHLLVAVDAHDAVAGFACCGPSRDDDAAEACGQLHAIYVDPDRWSEGIGTALLRAAAERMCSAGNTTASLWVLETNARTRRFYERHGWRPDGLSKREEFAGAVLHEVRYVMAMGER